MRGARALAREGALVRGLTGWPWATARGPGPEGAGGGRRAVDETRSVSWWHAAHYAVEMKWYWYGRARAWIARHNPRGL